MRYEYRVTFDDFKRSVHAWRCLTRWRRVSCVIQLWLVPAVEGIVGVCMVLWALQEPEYPSVAYILAVGCFTLAILGVLLPGVRLKKAYKQRIVMTKGHPIYLEFDEEGIRFIVPDGADVHYKWSAFTGFHEDSETATLFVTKEFFHTIPKSAMPEPSWQLLRSAISPHVHP